MKQQFYSVADNSGNPSTSIQFSTPSDSTDLKIVFLHVNCYLTDAILPNVNIPCKVTATVGAFAGSPFINVLSNVAGGVSNGLEFYFGSDNDFHGELFVGNRNPLLSLSAGALPYFSDWVTLAPNPQFNFYFSIGFGIPDGSIFESNLEVLSPQIGEQQRRPGRVFPPVNPTSLFKARQ